MAVNISEVRLLAVPLDSEYKNTGWFETPDDQMLYFTKKVINASSNVSYIKDNSFVFPEDKDALEEVNYVAYKNVAYNNRWFYAFVTDKERLNDGATRIHIKTDSIQTYMFDVEAGYCFVEREHVDDDTKGAHTIPEGLETGEYICDGWNMNEDLSDTSIVVGSTIDIKNYTGQPGDWNATREFAPFYGDYYDGIYSGLAYYVIHNESWLQEILKCAAYEGQEDAIHTIFMAPKAFLNYEADGHACNPLKKSSDGPVIKTWTCVSKPTSLDDYIPKNNKLLTYPYCYLLVDNAGGCAVPYHYEKFSDDSVTFDINSTIAPGMSIRAIPKNYNGVTANDAEGINLAKYATCSWNTDVYTSWLAKNGTNVGIGTLAAAGAAVGALTAIPTGGASLALVGGAVAGGASAIASNLATVAQHAQLPPQLHGNTNCGDVQTARGGVTFSAYKMNIKKEYAEIIDRYFTMYGYRINCFKIPNKNHRKYFWYTKTIDATLVPHQLKQLKGIKTIRIPQEDAKVIKDCLNRGITFWRDPDNIGKMPGEGNPIV